MVWWCVVGVLEVRVATHLRPQGVCLCHSATWKFRIRLNLTSLSIAHLDRHHPDKITFDNFELSSSTFDIVVNCPGVLHHLDEINNCQLSTTCRSSLQPLSPRQQMPLWKYSWALDQFKANYIALMSSEWALGGADWLKQLWIDPHACFFNCPGLNLAALLLRYRRKNSGPSTPQ